MAPVKVVVRFQDLELLVRRTPKLYGHYKLWKTDQRTERERAERESNGQRGREREQRTERERERKRKRERKREKEKEKERAPNKPLKHSLSLLVLLDG